MLIEIKNLNKSFKNRVVLDNVNFDIPEKGIILLKGKNGTGKSTLLTIISKFIKKDSGLITYSDDRFFEKSGFLLDVNILIDDLSFEDNMQLIGSILKMEKVEVEKKIAFYQNLFSLPRKEFYKNYSLGMKRKAELTRTLINNPQYIFWDEPFNSLDQESVKIILDQILDKNKLYFIITHEDYLDEIAHEILILD
ncbi:ATP-binding cassette domain-containing protein [Kaistella carnis]|uniref:ABC transporter ATP-binding protein n=1 Tax=Kaistella carnis TaxID=1241979 RepID=A0A3G8XGY0_9FLAO|nr:ATP-binding cassette domain-containing protein [Kaistella carnis]AZI32640.1 ABC transporter ATP-binding protein [Kaistella carnis]